jgi:hypothetical protein
MSLVRYRPGEAIKWLQAGAENMRKAATAKGRGVVRQTGVDQRPMGENVKTAAGAIFDFGKSAYADAVHRQAESSEYVLQPDRFDVVHGSTIRSIPYERVKQSTLSDDRARLTLDKGSLVIKPFAHIVAGRLRVPVGWNRNGMEVPFELLIQELAARCNLDLDEE